MIPLALFALLPDARSDAIFDRAIAWVSSTTKGAFTTSFRSDQNGVKKVGSYAVEFIRPDRMRVHARVEGDRTFTLVGKKLYASDARAREYVATAGGNTGSVAQRMAAVVPVDEPVRIVVDPSAGKNFLATFKEIKAWKVSDTTAGVELKVEEPNGGFVLGFDRGGRISRVRVESKAGWLEWSYAYREAPKSISFTAPRGFSKVSQLVDTNVSDRGLPKFGDSSARRVVEAAMRAYSRVPSLAYSVSESSGSTRVWLKGNSIRQRTAKGEWTWHKGVLSVVYPVDRTFRTGKATWRIADETVGRLGLRVDPLLGRLARKENPILGLLSGDMKGKTVGTMKAGGVLCDVVEFTTPTLRLTLTVRRDTRLLHASSADTLDRQGRTVGHSERRYEYGSTRSITDATFALPVPSGYRRRGL